MADQMTTGGRASAASEALEERVRLLLLRADKLRAFIEAHDFSLAASEARTLDVYCQGTNVMANRLADSLDVAAVDSSASSTEDDTPSP
jgi:hypothetical protein